MNAFTPVETPLSRYAENFSAYMDDYFSAYPHYQALLTRKLKDDALAHFLGFISFENLSLFLREIKQYHKTIGDRDFKEIAFPIQRGALRCFNYLRLNGVPSDLAYEIRRAVTCFNHRYTFDVKEGYKMDKVIRHKKVRFPNELCQLRNIALLEASTAFFNEYEIKETENRKYEFINNIANFIGFIDSHSMHDFCNELYPIHVTKRMSVMSDASRRYERKYKRMERKRTSIDSSFVLWAKRKNLSAFYVLKSFS